MQRSTSSGAAFTADARSVSFARRIFLQPRLARPSMEEMHAVETLAVAMVQYEQHIRRLTIRLAEPNDARARAKICRVHVALLDMYDLPSFLVEGRATHELEAARLAAAAAATAVERAVYDSEHLPGQRRRRAKREAASAHDEPEEIEVVPVEPTPAEVRRRTTPRGVKTAHPRRGAHVHKTQRQSRATSAREVSATTPSRKSTRKSANRSKRDTNQTLRNQRAARSSKVRADVEGARTRATK